MTLTEFLLARIEEDEGAERELWAPGAPLDETPSRRLLECESKRLILSLTEHGCGDDYERVQRALALPYVDHPDYRQEWKP